MSSIVKPELLDRNQDRSIFVLEQEHQKFGRLFHRFDKIRGRGPFEREPVPDFPYDALLQRLDEVRAGVSARDFGAFT